MLIISLVCVNVVVSVRKVGDDFSLLHIHMSIP